jgi:hypothetical protein
MNWEEQIAKFNLPHAKLLYLIYHFSKNNLIDKQQTIKLKEYVILESEVVFRLLMEFQRSKDIDYLLAQFKELLEEENKYAFNHVADVNEPEKETEGPGLRLVSQMQFDPTTIEDVFKKFI